MPSFAVDRPGHRDFCHPGGTSLPALRVLDRVCARLGIDLPATAFFQCPTVRSFAAHLQGRDGRAPNRQALQRAAMRRSRAVRQAARAGALRPSGPGLRPRVT